MGKIINNNITSSFSGAFGDDIVFRKIDGRSFFSRKGVNRKPPSPSQNRRRKLFAEAQQYASLALETPEDSEWYCIVAMVNKLRSSHQAAMQDFMMPPEIEGIDTKEYKGRLGNSIHIKPKALLKIEKIEVVIHGGGGNVLESGVAVKSNLQWKYSATVINPQVGGSKIVLITYDRVGKSLRTEYFLSDPNPIH